MRLLEVLEVFGMVWKVLEGFASFGGFCEAMRSFERRGEALGGFIDFGWLCHALGGFGFGRLWEAFEKPWGALGGCGLSIVCPSPRLWEALGSFGSLWEVLGGFGRLWEALEGFGRFWKALEGMGRLWEAFGCFGMLWKVGSLALVQWMLWKVLEALGVSERYGRLLEDFRKL